MANDSNPRYPGASQAPMEYTPADLAFKINVMEDRLINIFDRMYDLVQALDGRLKVIEAVLTAPPACNTRSRS
jgi:hypothetical protein